MKNLKEINLHNDVSSNTTSNQAVSDLNKILALNNMFEYYDRNGLPVIYSYAQNKSYIFSSGEWREGPSKFSLDRDSKTITQRFFEMKYPDLINPFPQ